MLKFSVITINYNNKTGLQKTIESVVTQSYAGLEYLVIDGGSTDGSVEVISNFSKNMHYHISEKDKGIYDAQNKGIQKASGDYLLFLNSGDCFHDVSVLENVAAFIKSAGQKIVYGNTEMVNDGGTRNLLKPPANPDLNFWYMNTLNHQAVFAHKDLFKDLGMFNLKYRYAADFDHIFRAYRKNPGSFAYVNEIICDYDNTGLTSNTAIYNKIIAEREDILKNNTTEAEYKSMRQAYLKTLSFKKKYSVLSEQNILLKYTLKPVYGLYKSARKIIKGK